MKSTSQSTSRWRIRSERKKTAPLSTPIRSRSRPGVVARDLAGQLAHAMRQLVGLDEDVAYVRVRHGARV